MRRQGQGELVPLDPEPERTANRQRVKPRKNGKNSKIVEIIQGSLENFLDFR